MQMHVHAPSLATDRRCWRRRWKEIAAEPSEWDESCAAIQALPRARDRWARRVMLHAPAGNVSPPNGLWSRIRVSGPPAEAARGIAQSRRPDFRPNPQAMEPPNFFAVRAGT